jgi:hypothetical protein
MQFTPKHHVRAVAGRLICFYAANRGEWFWRAWADLSGRTRHGPFPTLRRAMEDCADASVAGRVKP